MSRAGNPFRPGVVALLLLVGVGAFLLLLYALGQGWNGQRDRNGGEHAASTGLVGFAGIAELLEETGHDVTLSRNRGDRDAYGLLVLTPPHFADGKAIAEILEERRYRGPTLLILPKWYAMPIPEGIEVEAEEGWVFLMDGGSPGWFEDMEIAHDGELATGETRSWNGYGDSGALPDIENVQALVDAGPDMEGLVVDAEGDLLAGLSYFDDDAWPVTVVFEPDLINNYGLADEARAQLAYDIVHTAMDGDELPILFDLTLPGLGASENLLTLAFSPPFLAATLCLLLAALVIAWRGFRRFGPPVAEAPAMSQGKRQLALNGAALLARVKRWHLLAEPYAALVTARIARNLGLREHEREARERAIDRLLAREGYDGPGFSEAAHTMRDADTPGEIVRAARALRTIERTLTR